MKRLTWLGVGWALLIVVASALLWIAIVYGLMGAS